MLRLVLAVSLSVLIALTISARADDLADCNQSANEQRTIKGCTNLIKSKRLDKQNLAFAYSNRGEAYWKKGEHDRAIADYDEAIKINPKFAMPYNNRGVVYGAKGEFDRAIQDYDTAIKLFPKLANAYYNRGLAYAKKGEYDRAIQDHDQAIKLNPKDADAYYNRGNAYENYRNEIFITQAIEDYRKALELNPSHELARNKLKALGETP